MPGSLTPQKRSLGLLILLLAIALATSSACKKNVSVATPGPTVAIQIVPSPTPSVTKVMALKPAFSGVALSQRDEVLTKIIEVTQKRLQSYGVVGQATWDESYVRVQVLVNGEEEFESVKGLVSARGNLEFKKRTCKDRSCSNFEDEAVDLGTEDITKAYPGRNFERPIINIEFNDHGSQVFCQLTKELAGTPNKFSIFLDGKELLAPVTKMAICDGKAFIEGADFSAQGVKLLAGQLSGGMLPVEVAVSDVP